MTQLDRNTLRATLITDAHIWQVLEDVKDPEIPVVSVVEMGIVRHIRQEGDRVTVTITPTFAGCPAIGVMREGIITQIESLGLQAQVETVLSPPWSSDWISDAARDKLRDFGLAPPIRHGGNVELVLFEATACPYCGSTQTRVTNTWGATSCKMIQFCEGCHQPFEGFKPL